jgi:hypothetical protein
MQDESKDEKAVETEIIRDGVNSNMQIVEHGNNHRWDSGGMVPGGGDDDGDSLVNNGSTSKTSKNNKNLQKN